MEVNRLGKYELRATIGRGAVGVVHEAWDPMMARTVAIKVLPLLDMDDEGKEQYERFKREAQAAARLHHPNIVSAFDYGETDSSAYIVMEFLPGPSLKALLAKREPLDLARIGGIMHGMLAGLQHSHRRGVVHRDIKPGNVVFSADDEVKITDFGIAHLDTSGMTRAGSVLGTPAYMAPEQVLGDPVDARTDLFSAGVVLYEMLTARRPFEGSTSSVMHKIVHLQPPRPSELAPTVSPAIDCVIATAIAKRPEDRYQSATAFDDALQAALLWIPPAAAEAEAVPGLDSDPTVATYRPPPSPRSVPAEPVPAEQVTTEPVAAEPVPSGPVPPKAVSPAPVSPETVPGDPVLAQSVAAERPPAEPLRREPMPAAAPATETRSAVIATGPTTTRPTTTRPTKPLLLATTGLLALGAIAWLALAPGGPHRTVSHSATEAPTPQAANVAADRAQRSNQRSTATPADRPAPSSAPPTRQGEHSSASAAPPAAIVPAQDIPHRPGATAPTATVAPTTVPPASPPSSAIPQSTAGVSSGTVPQPPHAAPPAPARSADDALQPLRQQMQTIAASAPCSMISGAVSTVDTVRLHGLSALGEASEVEIRALLQRAIKTTAPDAAITWDIQRIDGPYCLLLDLLRPLPRGAVPFSVALSLPGNRGSQPRDRVPVAVDLPHRPVHLALDLFGPDGSVRHLYAGPVDGARTYTAPVVRPGQGDHVLTALVTSAALFGAPRPQQEVAGAYLQDLQAALVRAGQDKVELAVDAVPLGVASP